MTMRVTVKNEGPEMYTTQVNVMEYIGFNHTIIKTEELTMGESKEYTLWEGRYINVSEKKC